VDALTLLQDLLNPLEVGSRLGAYRIEDLSDAHGMRVTLSRLDGARVFVEIDARDDRFSAAARTERLAFSYRSADLARPIAAQDGRELARQLAAHVERRETSVLAELSRAASVDAPSETRVRDVTVRRALEPGGEGAQAFESVSPYVGCLIGCSFCYAQERLHRTRSLLGVGSVPWGSWVDVRVNLPDVLRAELASDRTPLPIKLCPIVSDPYQAIEARRGLTRAVLEVLRDDGQRPVLVLTRSALVRRDLGLLAEMRAHVGFSLPTARDEISAVLEPRSASLAEREAILLEARRLGVRTLAVVQPIFDRDVTALAELIARTCDSAHVDVLRGAYGAGEILAQAQWTEIARDDVQAELAARLVEMLERRGVAVWSGELPPTARSRSGTEDGSGHEGTSRWQ